MYSDKLIFKIFRSVLSSFPRPATALPAERSAFTPKTKQCTRSWFVQHKPKQFCLLLLKFVELLNQLALSTMAVRAKAILVMGYQRLNKRSC